MPEMERPPDVCLRPLTAQPGSDSAAQQISVFIQKSTSPPSSPARPRRRLQPAELVPWKDGALSLKSDRKEAEDELKQIKSEEKEKGG